MSKITKTSAVFSSHFKTECMRENPQLQVGPTSYEIKHKNSVPSYTFNRDDSKNNYLKCDIYCIIRYKKIF